MQTKFCDELRNHLDAYNEFTSIPTVMCELVLLVNMYILCCNLVMTLCRVDLRYNLLFIRD